ncbi:sporulation-specific protein 22 [Saxophila tyrrhenica]|uniref:Sporulation-specific protein 22 n=1 Tax=Saxophila tyrrhenica TaxID=1690608 RepID=A0AAV9PPX0_9PEZI|nr:sporulation-specific protein 22 [Saxophila tyrrhenica]
MRVVSARKVVHILQGREEFVPELRQEVERHVKRSFPVPINGATSTKISDFDTLGCDLWNTATNLLREEEQQPAPAEANPKTADALLPLLRTFAFLLLDTAHHAVARRSKDVDQQLRNFKIGLKACRFCLEKNELQLALKLLERCAEHVTTAEEDSPLVRMQDAQEDVDDREAKMAMMVSEYNLLRMSHACKTDRLDLADHFFGKLSVSAASSSALAELTAQLCLDAGKSLSKRGSTGAAVTWLRRAQSALDNCDLEQLSMNAGDLRLAIASPLAANDSTLLAKQVVQDLDSEHALGNRMAVQLLHLKVLLAGQPLDQAAVTVVLSRMLRTTVLTRRTFKMQVFAPSTPRIVQAIHRVRKISPAVASDALEQLITARLVPDLTGETEDSSKEWTEKACVTLVLVVTGENTLPVEDAVERLRRVFTVTANSSGLAFSPKATHATQTLIWKKMGLASPEIAEQ